MTLSELALLGGDPIRTQPFPGYNSIGSKEKAAVLSVMDSGVLSRFVAGDNEDFLGGPQVRAFETAWATIFDSRHVIAMNSATSGLYAAAGAAGIGPGDEVIVSPFTMMASVTAAVVFNAVPVFADIDPKTFCMDVESIRRRISPRTKAIIVVHIFGQPAAMTKIMALADEFGLAVIEDCAQAPLAAHDERQVGTFGHMAVFSLNYHKHIHTGEGGMVTTNDETFAHRLRLIRNHAEAVVGAREMGNVTNMVGFNFRMGEIEAAIGLCQLDKAPGLIKARQQNVAYLESCLACIPGLRMPEIGPNNTHVYYLHTLLFDPAVIGVSREIFVEALRAELPPHELRQREGTLIEADSIAVYHQMR